MRRTIKDIVFSAAMALLAVICLVQVSSAQTLRDLKTCQSFATGGNLNDVIQACSVFIRTRRSVGGQSPLVAKALTSMYGIRGFAYSQKGENDRALEDFREALRIDPSLQFVYEFRANLYALLGDNARALEDYSKAIDPAKNKASRIEILKLRAELYQLMGDEVRARADYKELVELDPASRQAVEDLRDLNARWIGYLKEIQEGNDYVNWSGPPLDLFRNSSIAHGDASSTTKSGSATASSNTPGGDACAVAAIHWTSTESIGTVEAYEDHLARFPSCSFAGLARARLSALKTPAQPK